MGLEGQENKSSHRTLPFPLAVTQPQGIPPDFVQIIPHLSEKQGKRLPRSSNITRCPLQPLPASLTLLLQLLSANPNPAEQHQKYFKSHCRKIYVSHQVGSPQISKHGRSPRKAQGENSTQPLFREQPCCLALCWGCAASQGSLQHPASCSHCFHSTLALSSPPHPPDFQHFSPHLPWQCFSADQAQGGSSCSSPHTTSAWL